jgi:hypothetical protein
MINRFKEDPVPDEVKEVYNVPLPLYTVAQLQSLLCVTTMTIRAWLEKAGHPVERDTWNRVGKDGVFRKFRHVGVVKYSPAIFVELWKVVKPAIRSRILEEVRRLNAVSTSRNSR